MTEPPNEDTPDPAEQMYWEEVSRLLAAQVKQTTQAVEICLAEDLWEPALVLMLGFIDACAWLARPKKHAARAFDSEV